MRERTHERPLFRNARQIRQMLADVQTGSACADGLEVATILHRCVRLHVEALLLRQTTAEEDVDHRFGPWRLRGCGHRLQRTEMIHPEAQQADRARLNHVTAADGMNWMRKRHAPRNTPGFLPAFPSTLLSIPGTQLDLVVGSEGFRALLPQNLGYDQDAILNDHPEIGFIALFECQSLRDGRFGRIHAVL
jgi:hypothetical protein